VSKEDVPLPRKRRTSAITGQERRGVRRLVHGASRRAAQRTSRVWERVLGLHVIPLRYDDPIPRVDEIADGWWTEPQALLGIDLRVGVQLDRLSRWKDRYRSEWRFPERVADEDHHLYQRANPSYGTGDAEILWGMLREHRPARVIELGSGMTTRLAASALERNRVEGSPGELVAVDPYPGEITRAGFPGLTRLVAAPAQSIPIEEFGTLGSDDVLLVDSSHMFKVGSDVAYLLERVLPQLDDGVLVHLHDIYLPRPYPPVVYRERRWFWNEQDALRLYLSENPNWHVVWAVNALYRDHYDEFSAAIPGLPPDQPGPCSFWVRRGAAP
jgi:hypothetical protein